jgi:hypothetical protein
VGLAVLLTAALLALVSARPYAGGWNDGSRLATVECLVDYRSLVIDHSIFVEVPQGESPLPYPADWPVLLQYGTADKMYINGHFYSDKSPVPALLLAGVYQGLQAATGLTARTSPERFCWWMNLWGAGLAYVVAVGCIYRLTQRLGLTTGQGLLLTGSFALTTVAPAYARCVNNHIELLAVSAALLLQFVGLAEAVEDGRRPARRVLAVGLVAGLGYTIDLGVGPVLLVCTLGLVAYRCRRVSAVTLCMLGALPWLVLHHVFNYAVGGTLGPANAVPEYFQWPGCPFNAQNLTGAWKHESAGHFLLSLAALLLGKRGFLGHNLPLFLAVLATAVLLRRRVRERPEILFGIVWSIGTWLLYGATSTNSSGACCSIRWFVPLLAPAYFALALWLREHPPAAQDLLCLSGFGATLSLTMWWQGPWMPHLIVYFWPVQALAFLTWAFVGWRRRRARGLLSAAPPPHLAEAA